MVFSEVKKDLKSWVKILPGLEGRGSVQCTLYTYLVSVVYMYIKEDVIEIISKELTSINDKYIDYIDKIYEELESSSLLKCISEDEYLHNMEYKASLLKIVGIENILKRENAVLLSSVTLNKNTFSESGEFLDTYELYKIDVDYNFKIQFLKYKDTSTDRIYIHEVNNRRVYQDAIEAVASTFRVRFRDIKHVEYFIRQGDCILTKIKPEYEKLYQDNISLYEKELTRDQYIELLKIES